MPVMLSFLERALLLQCPWVSVLHRVPQDATEGAARPARRVLPVSVWCCSFLFLSCFSILVVRAGTPRAAVLKRLFRPPSPHFPFLPSLLLLPLVRRVSWCLLACMLLTANLPFQVRAVNGRFGVGSHWQQRRSPPEQQQQQQALVRRPSSLLSAPRWQDGDHSARVAHQALRDQQQQPQQQLQRGLDLARDRRPAHVPHNNGGGDGGGVLRVLTRERGYTIAAGHAASRRPHFGADVRDGVGNGDGGGGGGRPGPSQQHSGYGDNNRPRSKSSSHFHACFSAAAAVVGAEVSSPEQQDYSDGRMDLLSGHYRNHHLHRQARLQPHPALAAATAATPGGAVGSQDLHPPRGGGMHDGSSAVPPQHHRHHYDPRNGGGSGGGGNAASRVFPAGRRYSASPDISAAGRHGRREAFSVGYGDLDVGSVAMARSASCVPFSEQQQQQQPVGAGGGASGDRRAAGLRSPPWEDQHHSSGEDSTAGLGGYSSLGALDFPSSEWDELTAAGPLAGGLGHRHMSSASLHGGRLSGTTTPVYDGHRSQRQQQQRQQQQQQQRQRWEHSGVRGRTTDTPVMTQVRGSRRGCYSTL